MRLLQYGRRSFLVLFLIIIFPICAYATNVELTHCRILSFNNYNRVIFSLSGPFKYNYFTLKSPDRLVVDFTATKLTTDLVKVNLSDSDIKKIRIGAHDPHQLRLVFDLKKEMKPAAYFQKPHGRFGYRLMIDLTSTKWDGKTNSQTKLQRAPIYEAKPSEKAVSTSNQVKNKILTENRIISVTKGDQHRKVIPTVKQNEKAISLPQKPVLKSKNKPKRNAVVVIDPGHGGKDPGAIGHLGTREKDVVLAISKELYKMLKATPGVEVHITRSGDYFVTLRGRLKLARKGISDLFISIHADAYKNKQASGVSIFALSQRGATSEAAKWLAQKENASELMGGVDLADKSYLLRSVLLDLSQTATIKSSLQMGGRLLSSLRAVAQLHKNGVEQAPFVVLKSPDIPSVLVETGFISNLQEELRLRNPSYQHKIAKALRDGIVRYLKSQQLIT